MTTETVIRDLVDRSIVTLHLPGWDYADAYAYLANGNGPRDAMTATRSFETGMATP